MLLYSVEATYNTFMSHVILIAEFLIFLSGGVCFQFLTTFVEFYL